MRKSLTHLLLAILAGTLSATSASAGTDWDQAVAAYRAGNHTEAVAAFTRYVERVPNAYQGHQMLGTALLRTGDAAKAAAHLQRADELEPGQPAILLALGKALVTTGKSADACTVLNRINADTVDAGYTNVLFGLRARAECGDPLNDLSKLAEATNTAQAWASYGVSAQRAKDFATAVSALSKAAALAPNDAKVRRAEAFARLELAENGEPDKRLASYRAAIPAAKIAYATAVEQAEEAETVVEASTVVLYADVLIGARELGTAATVLDAATAATPDSWSFNHLRGRVYLLELDYSKSVAPFELALAEATADSETKQTLEQLGFAYAKLSRFDEAIAAYRAVGNSEALARAEANRAIAIENDEAEAFNLRREQILEQQRQADAAMARIREGGPPPTPNR